MSRRRRPPPDHPRDRRRDRRPRRRPSLATRRRLPSSRRRQDQARRQRSDLRLRRRLRRLRGPRRGRHRDLRRDRRRCRRYGPNPPRRRDPRTSPCRARRASPRHGPPFWRRLHKRPPGRRTRSSATLPSYSTHLSSSSPSPPSEDEWPGLAGGKKVARLSYPSTHHQKPRIRRRRANAGRHPHHMPPAPSTRSPRDGVVARWTTYRRRRLGTPLLRRPGTPRSNARIPLEIACGGKSVASKTLSNNRYSRNRNSSPPSAPISWGGR